MVEQLLSVENKLIPTFNDGNPYNWYINPPKVDDLGNFTSWLVHLLSTSPENRRPYETRSYENPLVPLNKALLSYCFWGGGYLVPCNFKRKMEIEGGPLPVFKYGPITPFITSDGTHLVEMDERLEKHPRSLTSPLKRDHFERKVVFQPSIYIHVHPFTWAMFNFSGVFCGGGWKFFCWQHDTLNLDCQFPKSWGFFGSFFFFLGGGL